MAEATASGLGSDSRKIVQIGIIVRDIEETSRAYAELFGLEVPRWSMTDPLDQAHTVYRGESTAARAKLAFLDMGSVQLELIEPVGGPSTWQDFLDAHGEGVHHIAFQVKGMADQVMQLESRGMPLVQHGDYTGGRYAYVDTVPQLKVILELLEND
jgi:catechol 2,3-dioxygenase-like lactoylglutathione lyase family enzyme